MIKVHKIIKFIYFKQQKNIIFNQNLLNSIIYTTNLKDNFRFLSSSQISNFQFSLTSYNKSSNQQQNRKPRDEEIRSKYIRFVNLEGQLEGTFPLKKILSSFDRTKYWLVQVSPVNAASPSNNSPQQLSKEPPICKLVSKRELYEKQKKSKKSTTSSSLKKELQLTWQVSPNDLTHKLSRAKEWLEKGHQLQVVISNRGVKKNKSNQDKSILDKIIKELNEFAKDIKEPKWTGGGVIIEMQGIINIHKDSSNDDSDLEKEK